MIKLRKWSDLNKAEKLGRKKSLKEAFIVFCLITFSIFASAFGCLLGVAMQSSQSLTDIILIRFGDLILLLFIMFALIFCLSVFIYFITMKQNISSAYDKLAKDYSKNLGEKMLVRGKPTKVKLLKTRDGHYEDFLLKDLPGRVDYYAVLEENHNIIVIYPKFSDENEKDFFDDISNERRDPFDFIEMEEFSSFCEIVDN